MPDIKEMSNRDLFTEFGEYYHGYELQRLFTHYDGRNESTDGKCLVLKCRCEEIAAEMERRMTAAAPRNKGETKRH